MVREAAGGFVRTASSGCSFGYESHSSAVGLSEQLEQIRCRHPSNETSAMRFGLPNTKYVVVAPAHNEDGTQSAIGLRRRPVESAAEAFTVLRRRHPDPAAPVRDSRTQCRQFALGTKVPIDQALQDVMTQIGARVDEGYGSYTHRDPAAPGEATRIERATDEVDGYRDMTNDFTAIALHADALNCGEQASLASDSLRAMGFHSQLYASPGADHVVAICSSSAIPSQLRRNMAEWSPSIYVCCPWSGVACRGTDFPAMFRAKMTEWANRGEQVFLEERRDNRPGGWTLANDPEWVEGVIGSPAARSAPESSV
jgi:hypothetical protein